MLYLACDLNDVVLQEHVDEHDRYRHDQEYGCRLVAHDDVFICVDHELHEVKCKRDIETELAFEDVHHESKQYQNDADDISG